MQRFRHNGIHSIIIYKSKNQEPIYLTIYLLLGI